MKPVLLVSGADATDKKDRLKNKDTESPASEGGISGCIVIAELSSSLSEEWRFGGLSLGEGSSP